MQALQPKLLVVGLDGGTYDVFRPLMYHGHMPNLSVLLQRSTWGELESTVPPFTASAWSTFITGQNPGKHGILSFQTRDRYNYDTEGSGFVSAERFDLTLWQVLSDAGKRVSVINVPMTYPPHSVNGHMIAGMMTPSTATEYVYPPALKTQLGEDYVIDVDFVRDGAAFRVRDFPAEAEMLAAIRHMTEIQTEKILGLWQNEAPWDFSMVVFTGTDRLFHFFWPYVSAIAAGHKAEDAPQPLNPETMATVLTCIGELDVAVGRLLQAAGKETTVFLMSDHGFGPAQQWRAYLNVWLEQLGLLTRRSAQGLFDLEYLRVLIGRHPQLKAWLRRLLPQRVQDSASDVARSTSAGIIDWTQTQAFFTPIYFQVCGVEINRRGSFRHGFVEPGVAYEQLRDRVIDEARRLQNPYTGEPVVQSAHRREDLYSGPYVETFPDVILILDPSYVGASSMAGTSLIEDHPHPIRSGEHLSNGIFAAAGPHLSRRGELKNLRLMDVPATLLYDMGVPIPDSFDGRVISELYEQAYLDAHPLTIQSVTPQAKQPIQDLSDEERQVVEERLRGLGYL